MNRRLTLVIAVYNEVRYLEWILTALGRQTMREFEVVVADDGSGAEIGELIERMRPDSLFVIRHIWHEDRGFRKNVILNKAISAAETDYLVFIDGDCVPHHEFLADHQANRVEDAVLCGRRVNFSRQITSQLTSTDFSSGAVEKISARLLVDGLLARSSNLEDAVRIPNRLVRRVLHRNKARILGCNFSVERKLLERINGFNEEYRAPGVGEDTDIAYRLGLIGARFLTLRYLAILYHLYHPPTIVGSDNLAIYERVVRSGNPVCARGLREAAEAEAGS